MSYYDNVKNSVKDKDDTGKPNFETLRKAAQETSEEEDEKTGDDTEIEVLEDGLNKGGSSTQSSSSGLDSMDLNKSAGPTDTSKNQNTRQQTQRTQSSQKQQPSSVQDTSSLEKKLDTIIDQNERMIEILESFGS